MNTAPKNWKTKYHGRSSYRKRKTARKLELVTHYTEKESPTKTPYTHEVYEG